MRINASSSLTFKISLKMAERSEAKNAKRSFASKIPQFIKIDAKLRFVFLASLRSAIFSEILLKWLSVAKLKTRSEASRQKYFNL